MGFEIFWWLNNFLTGAAAEEEPAGPKIQLAMWVCIFSLSATYYLLPF
jgi:hypothetical protein